jgi:hypothetical protein
MSALESGDNVVIYPEVSENGYLPELEGFQGGFAMFADICRRKGMDIKIFVSYFRKSDNVYIIDAPVMYSQLCERFGADKAKISEWLCNRCNELGKMQFSEDELQKIKEHQHLDGTSIVKEKKIS